VVRRDFTTVNAIPLLRRPIAAQMQSRADVTQDFRLPMGFPSDGLTSTMFTNFTSSMISRSASRIPVCEFCDELVNTFRWIHWIFVPRILASISCQ
jgi:hypothetical protein